MLARPPTSKANPPCCLQHHKGPEIRSPLQNSAAPGELLEAQYNLLTIGNKSPENMAEVIRQHPSNSGILQFAPGSSIRGASHFAATIG